MYLKEIEVPLHDRARPERTFRPLPRKERIPARPGKIRRGGARIVPGRLRSPGRKPFLPGRLVPGLLLVPDILDAIDDIIQYPNPHPYNLPAPWYFHANCGRYPGSPPYVPDNTGAFVDFGTAKVHNCLEGQIPGTLGVQRFAAPAPYTKVSVAHPANAVCCFIEDTRATPAIRARHDESWWRDVTGAGTIVVQNVPVLSVPDVVTINPRPNANVQRVLPGTPPVDWRVIEPEPEAVPPSWQWSDAPVGAAPPPVHVTAAPTYGTKENKNLSRAAKVGIFLWGLMDDISEQTEIWGAFYKGLPADVRKKAGCAKGVNIGQYGSDLNECMMRTLFENWDKLDGATAIKEIAKNVAEDMTIGAFHKFLGKYLPPGINLTKTAATSLLAQLGPEKYIAKRLGDLFKWLGL